jgi:hypothetical protein
MKTINLKNNLTTSISFIFTLISLFATNKSSAQGLFDTCFTKKYKIKINASKSIDTCAKDIKLTVSYTGNPSYIYWNDGYYGGTRVVNKSGSYQVVAYDSAYCMDTSNHVKVTLNENYISVYSWGKAGPDISLCNNEEVILNCYSTSKIRWNTGDTVSSLTVNKSGKYFAVSKSLNGCFDTSMIYNIRTIDFNSVKIKANGDTVLCQGDSVQLEATGITGKMGWYPAYSYDKKIFVKTSGTYSVYAYDSASGCSGYSNRISVQIITPPTEKLCMVTVDTVLNRNKLVWEKSTGMRIVSYNIYKESNFAGVFDLIGSVSFDSASHFIDTTSNPKQRPFTYYIAAVDSCGNESEETKYYTHTTLHLSANLGVSGENNLNWSDYMGIYPLNTYFIYRSNKGAAFKALGSVAATVHSYTDLTPPSGSNRYYIGIVGNTDCQGSKTVINSNMVAFGILNSENINKSKIKISPNPFNDNLTIQDAPIGSMIKIYNTQGQILHEEKCSQANVNLNLKDLSSGLYFLNVGNSYATKIIKN